MHPFLAGRALFPLQERLKGKSTYTFLNQLEKSQWLSADRLEELQFGRLKTHLEFAYQHVPYYRRLFDERDVRPDQIKDFADFRRVPFLTREALRDQFDDLRAGA